MLIDYFPTESDILNVYKTIDWGDIPESDLYELYVPSPFDNLMSISYTRYSTIHDWWVLFFFNKMKDVTFSILPTVTIGRTVDYYLGLLKNYDILDLHSQMKIKECVIQYFIYNGYSYSDAIYHTNQNLLNLTYRTDPVTISNLKDFLFMHIMEETAYSDPIKVPSMTILFKMKALMNKNQIAWAAN